MDSESALRSTVATARRDNDDDDDDDDDAADDNYAQCNQGIRNSYPGWQCHGLAPCYHGPSYATTADLGPQQAWQL